MILHYYYNAFFLETHLMSWVSTSLMIDFVTFDYDNSIPVWCVKYFSLGQNKKKTSKLVQPDNHKNLPPRNRSLRYIPLIRSILRVVYANRNALNQMFAQQKTPVLTATGLDSNRWIRFLVMIDMLARMIDFGAALIRTRPTRDRTFTRCRSIAGHCG